MSRIAIETMLTAFDVAYRSDRFHALLVNLQDVRPGEWDARPAAYSVEVFGEYPELSIADLVLHVSGALRMWTNQAFADGSLNWQTAASGAPRDMPALLAYLDAACLAFEDAIHSLPSDEELLRLRSAPGGTPVPTHRIISVMTNHVLYHSGEINRQRSLLRGAEGWIVEP